MDKDYLNYNPLSRVKRLQEPYKEERWFTQEEVRKILEAAKRRERDKLVCNICDLLLYRVCAKES